ncbi:MAG TPA: DUF4215 domain-containing protein [Candidatus Polarisedimenticolia bacterium]|jgi:cysteine-rich repeat protein|nr:DUF4215 domain-containing protein [Candidatus Polarisedimenticolia bacterium]
MPACRSGRRLAAILIALIPCLLLPAAPRGETGADRLERLRAAVRFVPRRMSVEAARVGAAAWDGAAGHPGPWAGAAEGAPAVLAGTPGQPPEVQASRGVAGTQSETSIAVFGSTVVVGFNQINGNRGSGAAWSTDGGLTFTDGGGLPTGGPLPKELLGDPSVTVCGNGTFYYASIYFPNASDAAIAVNVGTVSGTTLTWSNPQIASISTNDFLDKEWLTCDRATNTLYMVYTRFVNGNLGMAGPLQVEIIKSADGGTTWSAPLVLESSSTESVQIAYVAIGPDGEVYVLWERGVDDITAAETRLEFRRSLDFAASFDPRVVVRSMAPSFFPANVGYNREDTLEIGTIAVDTSTGPGRGNLYVIWVEREIPEAPERDVFLARSIDRGATWSAPVRVNDDGAGHDQVMPWVSVNSGGGVETTWYDYRNWTAMSTTDVYAARSTDGGGSFEPNVRVTTVPSSWFVPATFTPNFGDYAQCASEGTGFYPAWSDGRNNDIDVFMAHIATDTCGNGALDPFEQCDDGNTLDGDSCSGACAATPCGNGIPEAGEGCDDGNVRSGDGCSQTCRPEICGDSVVQPTAREECDDGNQTSGDGCSATCQAELDRLAWVVDERSRLVLQSVTTGRVIPIGDPGFHEMGDLAFDASGRLFGSTQFNVNLSIGYNGALVDMAPLGLPGRGAFIGWTGWLAVTAIDFHPLTGVLYGIAVDAAGSSRLVILDPATGITTATVGDLALTNARAMAFDAAGTLYVGTSSLYTVNSATAARTLVGGPIFNAVALAGMDFAPDGTLYGIALRGTGADGGLLRVNKATGVGTVLFISGRIQQQGIRFAPPIAVDRDLDGIHDVADCAPDDPANAPPGATAGLLFSSQATLTWSAAANARFHNVYRGTATAPLGTRLPGSVFDHVCFESADSRADGDLVSTDPSLPPAGTAFYYLTDGEGCGEGPLGSDVDHPAPNPSPCPTPP